MKGHVTSANDVREVLERRVRDMERQVCRLTWTHLEHMKHTQTHMEYTGQTGAHKKQHMHFRKVLLTHRIALR